MNVDQAIRVAKGAVFVGLGLFLLVMAFTWAGILFSLGIDRGGIAMLVLLVPTSLIFLLVGSYQWTEARRSESGLSPTPAIENVRQTEPGDLA